MKKYRIVLVGVFVIFWVFSKIPIFAEWGPSQNSLTPGEKLLRVGPTSVPPIIDGNLIDKCWEDATLASGFITVHGEWPREQTTGYVTYDDTCLYIAFVCNEPVAEKIEVETTKNDEPSVFGDDSVEIFLDINHDQATYYHFAINSIGTRYEAYVNPDEGIRKVEWNPELELKTKICTQYWSAEMRIPFASLTTSYPQPGDVWGINLNRNCRREEGIPEHSSWAMLSDDFNQPGRFGKMLFGSLPDVSYSILGVTDTRLRIKLRNGKEFPLSVQTKWASSLTSVFSQTPVTCLKPKEEKEINIIYDVRKWKLKDVPLRPDDIKMELTIINSQSEEIYDFRKALFHFDFLFPSVSMDRYYYTPDLRQMQVKFSSELENLTCFKVEIRKGINGKIIAARQITLSGNKENHAVSFDIGAWGLGRYLMTAHLQGEDGEKLYSINRVFFKGEIAPAKKNFTCSENQYSFRRDYPGG